MAPITNWGGDGDGRTGKIFERTHRDWVSEDVCKNVKRITLLCRALHDVRTTPNVRQKKSIIILKTPSPARGQSNSEISIYNAETDLARISQIETDLLEDFRDIFPPNIHAK